MSTNQAERDVDVPGAGEVARGADERVVVQHIEYAGHRHDHIVIGDLDVRLVEVLTARAHRQTHRAAAPLAIPAALTVATASGAAVVVVVIAGLALLAAALVSLNGALVALLAVTVLTLTLLALTITLLALTFALTLLALTILLALLALTILLALLALAVVRLAVPTGVALSAIPGAPLAIVPSTGGTRIPGRSRRLVAALAGLTPVARSAVTPIAPVTPI